MRIAILVLLSSLTAGSLPLLASSFAPSVVIEHQDAKIAGDGGALGVRLFLPEGRTAAAALILIPGSGRFSREMQTEPFEFLANALVQKGYAALIFDKRGLGESEGSYDSLTTLDSVADVGACIKFLQSHPRIPHDKIGLFGHSEGAVIAGIRGAQAKDIAMVILYGPPSLNLCELAKTRFFNNWEQLEPLLLRDCETEKGKQDRMLLMRRNKELFVLILDRLQIASSKEEISELLEEEIAKIRRDLAAKIDADELNTMVDSARQGLFGETSIEWFLAIRDIDPASYYARISSPALAIFGEFDYHVEPKTNLPLLTEALSLHKNEHVEVRVLEKLNHFYAECESIQGFMSFAKGIAPPLLDTILMWLECKFPASGS